MFVNASVEIKDGNNESWHIAVDSDGEIEITASCGTTVELRAGRKGKFFSDFMKAYKKAATAVGIFDTTKEVSNKTEKVDEDKELCSGCDTDDYDDCTDCGYCTNCCIC